MLSIADAYLAAGLSVVPADKVAKRPSLHSWRPYQEQRPTQADIYRWFPNATAFHKTLEARHGSGYWSFGCLFRFHERAYIAGYLAGRKAGRKETKK